MIIRTYAGREYQVNHEQASHAARSLNKGVKYITINGSVIATADIRAIEPGGLTQPDIFNDKQIKAPIENPISGSLKDKLKKEKPEVYKKVYER